MPHDDSSVYIVNGQTIEPRFHDELFRIIERKTGLDKGIALPILHGGNPIKHPAFIVTSQRKP